MAVSLPFTFASPVWLMISSGLVAGIILISILRRPNLPPSSYALIASGLILLTLSAGAMQWLRPDPRQVIVMVDLSPSTRTAQFRNVDSLRSRISQLLAETPHQIVYFAQENRSSVPENDPLADLPAQHTLFNPPNADAILLFSDARFEVPATAPPTYIAVDPMLQDPPDAAISKLEVRGQSLAASISNHASAPRKLQLSGSATPTTMPSGSYTWTTKLHSDGNQISARLTGADDPWPENDQLAIRPTVSAERQRWWVGDSAAPGGWRRLAPSELPIDPAEYLSPAVIVLNNIPATALSELQQHRLQQYVRDLGGALIILGGDHAFAAGGYTGTVLEALSPLSSSPPAPTVHWILLADSSGSMAGVASASTSKWDLVRRSVLQLLPKLPPEDPVSIGSFSENIRWWSQAKSAKETAALPLPPADVSPNGPTNLESALEQIIAVADAAMPKELLVLTDADAEIRRVDLLREGLARKRIRLHVLALAKGSAIELLRNLASSSGGDLAQELDPARWIEATQKLLAQAAPNRLATTAVTVRFDAELATLASERVDSWNRVWLKQSATSLATAAASQGAMPMAARWNVGAGAVLAAAFAPASRTSEAFAGLIAQAPQDPRFKVTWDLGSDLRVSIDAFSNGAYLNGEPIELELLSAEPSSDEVQHRHIPQIGPGQYSLSLSAPRVPSFATVRNRGRLLDRIAVAGRYAPEFDEIGNDLAAMQTLAARTGGRVIAPNDHNPINFPWPKRHITLTPWLAAIGAAFVAAGLARWRTA